MTLTRNALGQSRASPNGILQYALTYATLKLNKIHGKHRIFKWVSSSDNLSNKIL